MLTRSQKLYMYSEDIAIRMFLPDAARDGCSGPYRTDIYSHTAHVSVKAPAPNVVRNCLRDNLSATAMAKHDRPHYMEAINAVHVQVVEVMWWLACQRKL